MYIISILALIVALVVMLSFSSSGILLYMIDLPSLIILIIITIPLLFASGLIKDFIKSFLVVHTKNKEISLIQLKKAFEAVSMAIQANFYAGGFIAIVSIIIVLKDLNSLEYLGPNLVVAILPLMYAFAINIVLISIKYKLKLKILQFTQE